MKTKLLFLAVVLLTMLSTRAVAQNDASAMREQMKERLDELKALVPDGVKGLNETLKNNVNERVTNFTNLYNASPIQSYQNYEDAYDELDWFITRVNEYLAAYGEFTDNLAKLKDLIDNFNVDKENKQKYKTFAQNVYNAYKALSDYDMIALTDDDVDEQKGYDDDNYWAEPTDVTSENIESVADAAANHEYISTYGQFNAFFSQNTKELGSIYLEVAGTGTAESPEELTAQLRNPNFENADEQWWGTEWTSIGNSAAEQSGKPFITYQQVHLPAGYYTLVGYGMDRRGSWEDVLANGDNDDDDDDEKNDWNYNHRTYLFSHLGDDSDSTMVDAFKAKNMALTADITEGAGNISTCEVDGVTYYTPNDKAQYRAWEDAKIAMAGQGHAAVVQFEVWQDEGDFGSLGFAHRWHVDNTWFVADGIQLYYAKDDFPNINIDTPDCASVTITDDGWATLYTDKALAFSGIKGLTAYTAKRDGSTVTLTPVDNVPANTGVVLKGDAKTYNIPIIANSTTDKGELQGSATTETAFDAHATVGGIYVLGLNDNNKAQFEKTTSGDVPAGKPYLLVPTAEEPSSPLRVVIAGETTKSEYDLKLADGSNTHGTVTFSVGGNAATQAEKDDVVTVSVTPAEGYSAKDVTVRAYTSWGAASEILTGGGENPGLVSDITVTKNEENGTWTFTMPEANVWVTVTYAKNLQDAWIQAITDQTYTSEAIEPTVTVQDGSTVLTLGTDYTVAYTNNVNTGTATVTVTGTGNYSGTATANFTIVADKTALNNAITEAETYYNSIKDDHTEAAAALKTAIDNAKAMQEKGDATQEEVNNALPALTTAKTTAEGAVLADTKNELNDDITAAEVYYNSIKESNPTAAATFLEAINTAKAAKDNGDATQEQVDAAIAALASAKTTAEGAVLADTKNELNDAITDAEAYYNSIKDSNPEAAATFLEAINTAKAAKDNGDATQEQVEAAIASLSTAINTAKVEVSRITLTIPAKSYMARIDADKREIKNVVAGVKLYSVKNVTNTEVELTDELGVIAAEMPYFIYNDNDTEVEVSIIVSSEDADNVQYDSDHFKGTLVDKTFTDEDMEEADHYVLNGGSSFVWVKDAGTLSAGKCWIQLEKSPANARALRIVFEGETTGISTVKTAADTKDAAVYDLQGRRVTQPTKGLFIVNGKKVVVK